MNARLPSSQRLTTLSFTAVLAIVACAGTEGGTPDPGNPCAAKGVSAATRFPSGSRDGHPAPETAKRDHKAYAGRITKAAQIRLPANGRNRVRIGDFLIANDTIAAYIGNESPSDGMSPFGGEIVAIEPVAEDGLPGGKSQYGETLFALSKEAVSPDHVTVLNDGSDGKAAIVRASGVLKDIAFLEPFKAVFPAEYKYPVALDYVLEPGATQIKVRLSVLNITGEPIDVTNTETIALFHYYRSQTFTESQAYGDPRGASNWVYFDGGPEAAFAIRSAGAPLEFGLEVSGFQYFVAKALGTIGACSEKSVDYAEVLTAKGGLDGVLTAARVHDKLPPYPEVTGTVKTSGGLPLADARVHILDKDGKYLVGVTTDAGGAFRAHAPAGSTGLVTYPGYVNQTPQPLGGTNALVLGDLSTLRIRATNASDGKPLPVRIQVIPDTPVPTLPPAFGVLGEDGDRSLQVFAMNGDVDIPVPPGTHRVYVSHGYEWELVDKTVNAEAGKVVEVEAKLARSVVNPDRMCADFHVHSNFSFDSQDSPREKVKSAIADGLDIPVSSEHEWIADFQPIISDLGLTSWAFSFPSSELTTFTIGHFGVVPLVPRPSLRNNGAAQWIGKRIPQVFKEVNDLPEKPVLIVNHPSETALLGYFAGTGFSRATLQGSGPRKDDFSDAFAAVEVWNNSDFDKNREKSVADWFALLNGGKTVWGVGNSDSHRIRTSPVGYPRNCLAFGHHDPSILTQEAVRDTLRAGHSVVSGGIFMEVKGPGGERPGDTLTNKAGGAFTLTIQSPSWVRAKNLEVIVDGTTVETIELGTSTGTPPGNRWEQTVNVKPSESKARHWVVFHARGEGDLAPLHPGRKAFAVSNPVFF
ncbi:MAG: CehA/McbA family metallohydrolase [Polyangiaceae bacterium]